MAFTTNDRQVYHSFVYSVDFVQFLPRTNYIGGAFEDFSASAKIVKSRQSIRTYKMLVTTEKFSKETLFRKCGKALIDRCHRVKFPSDRFVT